MHAAARRELRAPAVHDISGIPAFLIGPTGGRLKPLLHFTLTEPLAFEAAFEEAVGGARSRRA